MFGTLPPLKGNAYYCWNLVKNLSQKIDVEFFTFKSLYPEFLYPGGTKDSDDSFIAVENDNLKIYRSISIYNPYTWIKAAFKVSGDLVHMQLWSLPVTPVWIIILSILKMRKKKVVLTVHNLVQHESSFYEAMLMSAVINRCDRYIVHVEKSIQQMHDLYGIPEYKTCQIDMGPHSVVGEDHKNGYSMESAKKEIGIDVNAKVLLFFGNIRDYKGVDDFIKSVAHLKKTYSGDVVGLIAGQPWGKPDKYWKMIKESGVENNIVAHFKYIPDKDVSKYFAATDVVLLPYKGMEAQSGVGFVALDYYKPLVVTNLGGLSDLVLDKRFAVEPAQPDKMAEKVLMILQDDQLAKKLSEDSKTLLKKFSWGPICDKTINIYKEMLSGTK